MSASRPSASPVEEEHSHGWTPFPFQREAWAAHNRGCSGLIHAPTGNGKYRMPTADELANGVNANCDVTIEGYTYSGPCLFDGFGGASFMVSRADGYPMTSQFEEVIVEADTNKIAMMSFRDTDGELQTGGQVSRASTKDACWNGDLLKVCAYAKKF